MTETIRFDFYISSTVIKELEKTAELLNGEYSTMINEDLQRIKAAWDSESGCTFCEVYSKLAEELKLTKDEVLTCMGEVKTAEREMYITEQEAKRIASDNEVR